MNMKKTGAAGGLKVGRESGWLLWRVVAVVAWWHGGGMVVAGVRSGSSRRSWVAALVPQPAAAAAPGGEQDPARGSQAPHFNTTSHHSAPGFQTRAPGGQLSP